MSAGRKPAAPTSEDVLSVEHMDDAALHREDREDGAVCYYLFPGGPLHRDDGPAFRATSPDGGYVEQWRHHGMLDRDDGPADILHFPDAGFAK